VGYYTEVAGLGSSPTDVTINGHVDVYNRCLAPGNCVALDNFWRSLSNLTINVMGLSDCRASANFWAVSQAAPIRRVKITGGTLSLMDYCSPPPQFASGGFMADSHTGAVVNGSQQQFLVRDSAIASWSNGVWNQVFSGVVGAPPQSFSTKPIDPPPYTTFDTSPVTRERPFLFVDPRGDYQVFVPAIRRDARGTSWSSGRTRGSSIPMERVFIVKPTDSAARINEALGRGLHLEARSLHVIDPLGATAAGGSLVDGHRGALCGQTVGLAHHEQRSERECRDKEDLLHVGWPFALCPLRFALGAIDRPRYRYQ
jgi:hypothetical protein